MDGEHDERALHADEAAQARIGAFKFLHQESVLDVVHTGATVAFEIGAEEAQGGHFGDKLRGEGGAVEGVAHERLRGFVNEAARGGADQQFLFGQEGIKVHVIDTGEARHGVRLDSRAVGMEGHLGGCIDG